MKDQEQKTSSHFVCTALQIHKQFLNWGTLICCFFPQVPKAKCNLALERSEINSEVGFLLIFQ